MNRRADRTTCISDSLQTPHYDASRTAVKPRSWFVLEKSSTQVSEAFQKTCMKKIHERRCFRTKKIIDGLETSSTAIDRRFFCSKESPPVKSVPTCLNY
jgi:hypothetical protein